MQKSASRFFSDDRQTGARLEVRQDSMPRRQSNSIRQVQQSRSFRIEVGKIVMKVLYLSMSSRPDTLWTVCNLARDVTKWTQASDDRLLRLMAYLNRTKEMFQQCWVGDPIEDCILAACSDASYADALQDAKSTSGAVIVLLGPRTFVPLTWLCKKQGAISRSSTEAETLALDMMMRLEAIPIQSLFDQILEALYPESGTDDSRISRINNKVIRSSPSPSKSSDLVSNLAYLDHVHRTPSQLRPG